MGKIKQTLVRVLINLFGNVYIYIEKHMKYPNDNNILGIQIDKFLQNKSRKELCRYMDAVLPKRGFFDIQSTSKIRLGCQLLRGYKQLKKNKRKHRKDDKLIENGSYADVDF